MPKRKKGIKSHRKSVTTGYYWTEEIDDLILEYQRTQDEQLFAEKIYPVFLTASKSIMYDKKYRLMEEDDINRIVARMYLAIPSYKKEKGSGFSYFSVTGKREIIQIHMKRTAEDGRNEPLHLNKYLEPDTGNDETYYAGWQMPPALIAQAPNRRAKVREHLLHFLDWAEPQLFKAIEKTNMQSQAKEILNIIRNTDCERSRELHKELAAKCIKKGIKYKVSKTTKIKRILRKLYAKYLTVDDAIVI